MRILLYLLIFLLLPLECLAEVKIIEIKHRVADDFVKPIGALLDSDEKITAAGGHLVLIADGESLQAAVQLIAVLDTPQKNLLISIRHTKEQQAVGKDLSASVRYATESTRMTGSGAVMRGTSSRSLEQQISIIEGGSGRIEIGQEIPFTRQWAALTGETTGYSETIDYASIATGFWIYPVKVSTENVLVDVEPFLSDATGHKQLPPQINYSQMRTRLQVPVSQWYPLGAQMMARDQVSQAIVSWRSADGQENRNLQIRIDIIE